MHGSIAESKLAVELLLHDADDFAVTTRFHLQHKQTIFRRQHPFIGKVDVFRLFSDRKTKDTLLLITMKLCPGRIYQMSEDLFS